MLGAERSRRLRHRLAEEGSLRVSVEAKRFGVSEETIRRDIKRLAGEGLADAVFGGAVLKAPAGAGLPPVGDRLRREDKEAIGAAAARLVEPGQVVIFDAGTTTLAVARRLTERDLTVVTNSLPVAQVCAEVAAAVTYVIGGKLVPGSLGTVGPQAERDLAGISADWAFLGAAAIEIGGGFTSADPYEAQVKRAMIGAARRTVVVADSSKFGMRRFAAFARAEDISHLVTTADCPPAVRPWLEDAGAALVLCEPVERDP